MEQGWIYVLVNSSMPGLAKVGRTTKSPQDRAAELSGATGVATPFVVAFDKAFTDCHAAEKVIHQELERRGLRISSHREFFRGSVSEVIRVVLEADETGTGRTPSQWVPAADVESGQSLLEAGDCYLFGTGDTLQDTGEAVRCYKLASARGSLVAFDRLGRIFGELYALRADRVGRRRALATLKEGVRRGNYYCLAEMATLFAGERHMANFEKAWELFLARRAEGELPEIEKGERYAAACCRYIGLCLAMNVPPKHRHALLPVVQGMRALLLEELDNVRTDAASRLRLVAVLRWIHQDLTPRASRPARRLAWPRNPSWLAPSQGARVEGVRV